MSNCYAWSRVGDSSSDINKLCNWQNLNCNSLNVELDSVSFEYHETTLPLKYDFSGFSLLVALIYTVLASAMNVKYISNLGTDVLY